MAIIPDTKDWTFVLQRPCDECGFDAASTDPESAGDVVLAAVSRWRSVLGRPGAATRPDASTWSAVEYACHVRDMLDLFAGRLELIRDEDDPLFENWDQDEAAVAARYDRQSAPEVAVGLAAAASSFASAVATVTDWSRPGRRSNGSVFTAATLTTYGLHDHEHHLQFDVRG